MDRGAWWATVHGVTESDRTERLNNKVLAEHEPLSTTRVTHRKGAGVCRALDRRLCPGRLPQGWKTQTSS